MECGAVGATLHVEVAVPGEPGHVGAWPGQVCPGARRPCRDHVRVLGRGRWPADQAELYGRDRLPCLIAAAHHVDDVARMHGDGVGARLEQWGLVGPLLELARLVLLALPDAARCGHDPVRATEDDDPVGDGHRSPTCTCFRQGQRLLGHPVAQRPVAADRDAVGGLDRLPVRTHAADDIHRVAHRDERRVAAGLRQGRALAPGVKVPGAHDVGHEHVGRGRCAVGAAREHVGRAEQRGRAVGAGGRQRYLDRTGLPGQRDAHRCRAGQGLVLGRAEVDRGPDEEPEVHGLLDGEVVRPVRDVPEHDDDHEEPEQGLDECPAPAIRVEQAEDDAASGDRCGECRLRHRISPPP